MRILEKKKKDVNLLDSTNDKYKFSMAKNIYIITSLVKFIEGFGNAT